MGSEMCIRDSSNINPDLDPMCRFCREKQETFIHFWEDCPALWQERRDTPHAQPTGQVSFVNPLQMIYFSFSHRINDALENHAEIDRIVEEMDGSGSVISDATIEELGEGHGDNLMETEAEADEPMRMNDTEEEDIS